jgi:sugar lactone lactonase YvrE
MFASNNSNIDQNNKDPEHMAIDSEGNIYVSERTGDQIQVYKPIINGNSTVVTS